jgi:hypothetical protein
MKGDTIQYADGFKYQLKSDYALQTDIKGHDVVHEFYDLEPDGWLTIKSGYCWDGASRAIDSDNFMRGSLVHDVLYQMLREGELPADCFHAANDELRKICLEDGMSKIRAWWVWRAVESFGHAAAHRRNQEIKFAP